MKKILIAVPVVFGLFCCANGFGETIEEKKYTWDFGVQSSYIKYEEPGVMKEEGVMNGINTAYTYRDRVMLKIDARVSYGQVDYENSGTIDNIDDYLIELRAVEGYGIRLSDTAIVTPYLGFGYRYLNDDSSGMTTSTGAKGYERESNYYYFPIGVEAEADVNDVWSIGAVMEYDYFLSGEQKSHLSDADASFKDLKNDQDDGYGLRGSVKLVKKGETADILIEPYINYWNIKKSNDANVTYAGVIVGYGYEPKNNSTEAGIKVAIKY